MKTCSNDGSDSRATSPHAVGSTGTARVPSSVSSSRAIDLRDDRVRARAPLGVRRQEQHADRVATGFGQRDPGLRRTRA